MIEKVRVWPGSFSERRSSPDGRGAVQFVTWWVRVVRFGTVTRASTAGHHLQGDCVWKRFAVDVYFEKGCTKGSGRRIQVFLCGDFPTLKWDRGCCCILYRITEGSVSKDRWFCQLKSFISGMCKCFKIIWALNHTEQKLKKRNTLLSKKILGN